MSPELTEMVGEYDGDNYAIGREFGRKIISSLTQNMKNDP